MRAGDIIYHRPTGAFYTVASTDKSSAFVKTTGWHPALVVASDCDIVSPASFAVSERLRRELETSCEPSDVPVGPLRVN